MVTCTGWVPLASPSLSESCTQPAAAKPRAASNQVSEHASRAKITLQPKGRRGKAMWQCWQVEEDKKNKGKKKKKAEGGLQTAFGSLSKRGMLGGTKPAPGSRRAEQ